ncbi:hypothetical protein [Streptomyces finlayi]|uniref:hypothetical protein n=1 Tax=Streptomyces finlayi TaxID=67296 RepID=UPI00162A5401|nr:hypothetical protein [Streptomyces finlayi]
MRGLRHSADGTDGGGAPDGGRGTARAARGRTGVRAGLAASSTAMAGLAAFALFGVSCSAGGTGTRDEGPAGSQAVAQVSPSLASPATTAQPTRRVNAVALLKRDSKVSPQVSLSVPFGCALLA